MRSQQTLIELEASELAIGMSRMYECGFCGRANKLSVTRNGEGLLYNCFSAHCGKHGFIPTSGQFIAPERKPPVLKPYHGEVLQLEEKDIEYFKSRFGICKRDCLEHISRNEKEEYVLPINDVYGLGRGYVVRQPGWSGSPKPVRDGRDDRPKARTWMHARGPVQSWYGIPEQTIVLVEDQISAIVVASVNLCSVALLGTQLNADKVREIASMRPDEVVVALDADATNEAFKLARKWNLAFNMMRVVILERDLKEEDKKNIRETLLL